MSTDEVTREASAFQGIREYTSLQRGEMPAEFALQSFTAAHTSFGDAEIAVLTERTLLMREYLRGMRQVGAEMQQDLVSALSTL